MITFIIFLIGYGFGIIQPAYIIGRIVAKKDIRKHGSMNAGASNITTMLGWKYGILTAVIDILKAVVPILLLKYVFSQSPESLFVMGIGVLLGHIYPIYLGFKGGKGTASFIGMMLAINPVIGLILSALIILVTIISNFIVLGTFTIMILNPLLLYFFHYSWQCILIACGISLLSMYKHLPNISRIIKGEEKTLRSTIKK